MHHATMKFDIHYQFFATDYP